MYQAPAAIWNLVAVHEPATRWGHAMAGNDAEIAAFLSGVESDLDKANVPARVQRAFFTVAPLVMEADAIAEALMDGDDPTISAVLVSVGSIREAVALADMEYRLDADEQAALTMLLMSESATQIG